MGFDLISKEEAIWVQEMAKNFEEPEEIESLTYCVCKHCGSIIKYALSMQHLKLMHPEPYISASQAWDDIQLAKK